MKRNNSRAGFSLVELAIVLVIIGLIVGGVLKGQDLIRSARVNSVQTDLNKIRAATGTFQDKYVALPGDFVQAEMLRGSWSNGSGNNGGNGNGRIGHIDEPDWAQGDSQANGENFKFWAHLAQAGMLNVVDPEATMNGLKGSVQSRSMQASPGGYYKINYSDPTDGSFSNSGYDVEASAGHWILLSNTTGPNADGQGVFAPVNLRSLDLKADDGVPTSGDIVAQDSNGSNVCVDEDDPEAYKATDTVACSAFFAM